MQLYDGSTATLMSILFLEFALVDGAVYEQLIAVHPLVVTFLWYQAGQFEFMLHFGVIYQLLSLCFSNMTILCQTLYAVSPVLTCQSFIFMNKF